ncbi:hypothetical protein ABLE92_07035 [Gordonia sp. VNQ95]|uniref:hypothetical protein n=1 Tax=Gordonia sp. VNQ95 TaxID=3156619 RepID=UPI0032B52B6D
MTGEKNDGENNDGDPTIDTTTSDADTTDPDTTDADTGDADGSPTQQVSKATASLTKAQGKPVPRSKTAKAKRTSPAAEGVAAADSDAAADDLETSTADTVPSSAPADRDTSKGTGKGKEFSITLSSRSLLRVLGAIVVVALIAGVAVLGWLYYSDQQRLKAFDASKQVSEQFVTQLVTTINPGNTDKYKEILGPLSTGALRSRLEQDRAATEQNSQALAIEATSKIVSSSVASFDTDTAKTTVMAEVTARSAQIPNGETRLMIFILDLQKVDGNWLVSDFSGPPGSEKSGVVDPSQSLPGQSTPSSSAPAPAPTQTETPAPTPAG